MAAFWPTADHWSVEIPLDTPHPRLDVLKESGVVVLTPAPFAVPPAEWESLEYMDWKSGGDTNFAPVATADGELDCRGFWKPGDERPDKGGRFTSNAPHCAASTVTTTTASTRPTRAGSCAAGSS